MKLILSSCDFKNAQSRQVILENLPKPLAECRLLFIPNEKSTSERLKSGIYSLRMRKHGFSGSNTLIFDPECADRFRGLNIDLLYVSGGNTFETLDRLRKCRFDQEITRYVRSDVTYIGGSAGAHIVTESISHLTRYDPVPAGMTDFCGLGLYPGILMCHFTEARRSHFLDLCQSGKWPVCPLGENDSIVYTV